MNTKTDPDFYKRLTAAARCLSEHCQYDDQEESAEALALEAVKDARAALEIMRDFLETAAEGNTEPDDLAAMAVAILADLDAGGDGSDTPDRYDARDNDEEDRADALNQ